MAKIEKKKLNAELTQKGAYECFQTKWHHRKFQTLNLFSLNFFGSIDSSVQNVLADFFKAPSLEKEFSVSDYFQSRRVIHDCKAFAGSVLIITYGYWNRNKKWKRNWWCRLPEIEQGWLPLHVSKLWLNNNIYPILFYSCMFTLAIFFHSAKKHFLMKKCLV